MKVPIFTSSCFLAIALSATSQTPVSNASTSDANLRVQPTSASKVAPVPTVNSPAPAGTTTKPPSVKATDDSAAPSGADNNYVLGPGDQVSLQVAGLDDEFTDQSFRIDLHGDVNLPLVGRFRAAGMTIDQFEAEAQTKLKKYVKEPDVVASVAEYHSQPVSVLGSVNSPGVHQLQGHKTLYEVLSMAGGLRQDAGNSIRITRDMKWGAIPLPNAVEDQTKHYSTASIKVKNTLNASDPAQNIVIMPGDVITVPQGEVVYAVGSVNKPGGFMLGESESLSTLQVISLAEGLDKVAAADRAMVLRAVPGSTNRKEIPVNLKLLMSGKAEDVPLQSNDILFVPTSKTKTVTKRTIDAMVQVASGVVMYGRY